MGGHSWEFMTDEERLEAAARGAAEEAAERAALKSASVCTVIAVAATALGILFLSAAVCNLVGNSLFTIIVGIVCVEALAILWRACRISLRKIAERLSELA